MQRIFLAIDIGASSGRHIVGIEADGALQTDEVYRFPNGVQRENGHLIWDIEGIFQHVKAGIKAAFAKYPHIDSLSIDTWAVDYVLLKDGAALLPCHAYRDERTQAVIDEVHQHMPFAELYRRTGIQFQPFNSIYQLYEDAKTGRLQQADDFLMVPEYLLYRLCGVKAREYTNATSTGLVSAATKEYDPEILRALSLPERLFPRLTQPGTVLGQLTPDVAREVGGQTSVVLCATRASRWRRTPRSSPPAHGRCSARRFPPRLRPPKAWRATSRTRAAWDTSVISKTSWACGLCSASRSSWAFPSRKW